MMLLSSYIWIFLKFYILISSRGLESMLQIVGLREKAAEIGEETKICLFQVGNEISRGNSI
jgi:hypothetical protein